MGNVRYPQIPLTALAKYYPYKFYKDDVFAVGENEKLLLVQNGKIIKLVEQPGLLKINKKEVPELECKLLKKDLENCELLAMKTNYPTIFIKFVNVKLNKENKFPKTTDVERMLDLMKFSFTLKIDFEDVYPEKFYNFSNGLKRVNGAVCLYGGFKAVTELLINEWVFAAARTFFKESPDIEALQILKRDSYDAKELLKLIENNAVQGYKDRLGIGIKAKVLGAFDKYGE